MESTKISIVLLSAAAVIRTRKAMACKGWIPHRSIPQSREGTKTSPTSNNCCKTGVKARVIAFVKKGRNASN